MEHTEKRKVGAGFGVMVLREGKVLLGQRHIDPIKADSALHGEGTWTMPGGKLEFGEPFEAGASRELLEETGMTVEPEDLKVISLANDIVSDAHFVTVGLLCESVSGEPQVMEPDEITKWEWFSLDSLPTPLFFPSKEVIENYKLKQFYKKS
ncbi:MAG: NUDIX domain-containing protein [Candidatus Taylorbacteria bacterium]|nr:NUDIX domain-containing protein [Candidatus Taylorbacteria bacterium]